MSAAHSLPVVVRRTIGEQVVVRRGARGLAVVALVPSGRGQHVTEDRVQPTAQIGIVPFGLLAHAHILPDATMST